MIAYLYHAIARKSKGSPGAESCDDMWLHQCVVGRGPLDSRLRGNDVMVVGMTAGG